jgi:hypothetical protein
MSLPGVPRMPFPGALPWIDRNMSQLADACDAKRVAG